MLQKQYKQYPTIPALHDGVHNTRDAKQLPIPSITVKPPSPWQSMYAVYEIGAREKIHYLGGRGLSLEGGEFESQGSLGSVKGPTGR